jgi:hypothetical protein
MGESVPTMRIGFIENLRLLVSCRALATGKFAATVQRTASEIAIDIAKYDKLKSYGQKDVELDFCFSPDTALFQLKLLKDLKTINVSTFEHLNPASKLSLVTAHTSFGNGLLFNSHFTGLDLLSVAEVIKWSEALRRTTPPLGSRNSMTKVGDCEEVADWCPWYVVAMEKNTKMVTEKDGDRDLVSYELILKDDQFGEPTWYSVMGLRLDPSITYTPLTLEDLKTAQKRLLMHLRDTGRRWEESFP